MSNASITSSKKEKETGELMQEIDSVRSLNNCLRTYLEQLQVFKKNLRDVNSNCQKLSKVNSDWIDTLNMMKQK